MLNRRRFNALLAATTTWMALGPRGTAIAQRPSRGAVYASVDALLYRIRRDGNTLTRDPRPLILPAQVQEAWPHPSGKYFYVASSEATNRYLASARRIQELFMSTASRMAS